MKKLKTFFLFVLSCCLLFSLSTSIFAAEFHPMAYGVFNGHISADSDSHNLEQIEIKVYSSILSQQNNIEGFRVFNEEYEFSIYPDANGNFSFYKPSANFSLTVNTATLPINTGMNTQYGQPYSSYISYTMTASVSYL